MNTLTDRRGRAIWRATGALMIGCALLLAAGASGTTLQATQEPDAPVSSDDAPPTISRSRDLSDEAIEAINPELAASLSPLLATLFDATQSDDARTAAADGILETAKSMSVTGLAAESLQRKLSRRAALIKAAIAATATTASPSATAAIQSAVQAEATKVSSALSTIRNGELWSGYLHLSELGTGEASVAVLRQVRNNLNVTDSMDDAQKKFLARPEMTSLATVLDGAIAAAAYDGDSVAVEAEQQRQIAVLAAALLEYEQLQKAADAEHARSAWRLLRNRFPEAADILRPSVNQHYFNHNLHFTVSEDLLSRLVSDYRTESGCIADCILGAWVTGSQNTDVRVRADVKRSASIAQFDLLVNGNTRSNTKAQKDPATVWTSGNHYFWINKSVYFDGRTVTSSPAMISVDTNSRTTGLATKYDGIPIIRRIVRKIAVQKIAESKPQSEAITASKLRSQALPKFEDETNRKFSESNTTFQTTLDSLERRGVAPDSISTRSSNTHIAMSSRTIGTGRVGGSVQPPAALLATGAAVQLHESALNNAIDALGFQGRTILEKDFAKELESALSELFQRDIKLTDGTSEPVLTEGEPANTEPANSEPEPPTEFVFSKTDPIRVRFSDGQISVVLRTGVRQEGKEEIPEQIITIPITMTLEGGKVVLNPAPIRVESREETDRLKQVTRANQIRRIFARRIVRRELSPTIDLQAAGDRTLPVTVTLIELADGWLTAEFM